MRSSTVLRIPDVEDGGYTVKVPLLPAVVTCGDTVEEALAMAREAITLCLRDEDSESTLESPGPKIIVATVSVDDPQ